MMFLLLHLLGTADAACCGYRAAAGRNAYIRKRDYYRRALLRGALYGQGALALLWCSAAVAVALSTHPSVTWQGLVAGGRRMLIVYMPYATVLGLAFAFRAIPSVDVRSLTSTLVFGPLTLLRPVVLVTGVAWGVMAVPSANALALGVLTIAVMLSLEPLLGLGYRGTSP